eukprot:TRINITY_DN9256_c0_g4_i2.p1 TRINITY_DN9256_c0_g4~~TRINITY_DN9256_c0_g4_i2.p1  ORF type:complete len:459 (-),score=54.69 TRINITY_DN9256_c0_g4_i2:7-1383(-)
MNSLLQTVKEATQKLSEQINSLQNDLFSATILNQSNISTKSSQIQNHLNFILNEAQKITQEIENQKSSIQKMSVNISNLQYIFSESNENTEIQELQVQLKDFAEKVQQELNATYEFYSNKNNKKIIHESIFQLEGIFQELKKQMESLKSCGKSLSKDQRINQFSTQIKQSLDISEKLQDATVELINEMNDICDINNNLKSACSQLQKAFVEKTNDNFEKNQQIQIEEVLNVLDKIKNMSFERVGKEYIKNTKERIENLADKNWDQLQPKNNLTHFSKKDGFDQQVQFQKVQFSIKEGVDQMKNREVFDEVEFLRNQIKQLSLEKNQVEVENLNIQKNNDQVTNKIIQLQNQKAGQEEKIQEFQKEIESITQKFSQQQAEEMEPIQVQLNQLGGEKQQLVTENQNIKARNKNLNDQFSQLQNSHEEKQKLVQQYQEEKDRKSTRLNSSHEIPSRMPSSA